MSDLPRALGSYELLSVVGDLPVGAAYRARRTADDVPVRLIVLDRQRAGDAGYRERFLRVAQVASGVQHTNLEVVLEAGEAGGECFLATEWIEGITITEWLSVHGPLPEATVYEVGRCCAAALDAAWAAGQIVHGALSIEDIMVRQDGVVKLRNLALAKPQEGSRLGDMRALGAALYQALVGEPAPQPGHRLPNLADKRQGLNPHAGDVLEKMLSTQAQSGYASYEAMIEDLGALIEGRQPPGVKPVPLDVGGGLSLSQPAAPAAPTPLPPGLEVPVSRSQSPLAEPIGLGVKAGGPPAGGVPKPPPPAAAGSMQLSIGAPAEGPGQLKVEGPSAPDESALPSYARQQAVEKKKLDWKIFIPPVAALVVVGIGWVWSDGYVEKKHKAAREEARAAAKQLREARLKAAQEKAAQQPSQPGQQPTQPSGTQPPPAPPPAPAAPEFDKDALAKYRQMHAAWVDNIRADGFEDAAQMCEGTVAWFRERNQPVFVTAMQQLAADARRLAKLSAGLKAHAGGLVGQKVTVSGEEMTVQSADADNIVLQKAQGGTITQPFSYVVVGKKKAWLASHPPAGVRPDPDVVIAGALFALYALGDAATAEECLQVAAGLGVDVARYRALCKQQPGEAAPVVAP